MSQLDTLPPEILFNILTFTEPACNPTLASYPLNTLAETNKQLNAIVEEYARGQLKQHAGFTPPKSSKTFTCRRKWLAEICQICKKSSKRKATLYPTLTCCRLCDNVLFPKMTMTEATRDYSLSRLDLFTPNVLHPHLPALAVGAYAVMAGTATMISESDVHARRDHIRALLGTKAQNPDYMRKRSAAHTRITRHMGVILDTQGKWKSWPSAFHMGSKNAPKSMRTEESRSAYVQKALEKEWEAMGVSEAGST